MAVSKQGEGTSRAEDSHSVRTACEEGEEGDVGRNQQDLGSGEGEEGVRQMLRPPSTPWLQAGAEGERWWAGMGGLAVLTA